jgi:hypothetical protein
MSSCRNESVDYTDLFLTLIESGLSPEEATTRVATFLKFKSNKAAIEKLKTIVPDIETKVVELTDEEKKQLEEIWSEIENKADEKFLERIGNLGETGERIVSAGDLIREVVGREKGDLFFAILTKKHPTLLKRQYVRHKHIQELKRLVKIHKNLGDNDVVEELESAIEIEEDRLIRIEENAANKDEKIFRLKSEEAILMELADLAGLVRAGLRLDVEDIFRTSTEELKNEGQRTQGKIAAIDNKLKVLYNNWKAAVNKKERQERKEKYYKFKEEKKEERKKLVLELKEILKKVEKARIEFINKEYKTFTGKTLSERELKQKQLQAVIEARIQTIKAQLIAEGVANFSVDTRDIELTTKQVITAKQRLQVIVTEGLNARIESSLVRLKDISVVQFEQMFGKAALDTVIRNRERIKDADGKESLDYASEFTEEEVRKAGNIWKNQMISTYDGSFFAEDPALVTEEGLEVLSALMNGNGVVDSSSPSAVDPTFPPTKTVTQALKESKPGEIPKKNIIKSHREASRVVESSLRRLRSVFGFTYFNGVIPEKVLRQILHPKLMDISPKAFEDAIIKRLQPRIITTMSPEDRVNYARTVLELNGGNTDVMPEFRIGANWHQDNSRLISFDIETYGNIDHPTDKVDGVYSIQLQTRDSSDPTNPIIRTEVLVNHNGNLVNALDVPAPKRQPLTKEQITSVLQRLEDSQNNGYKVITHNGNNFDFPQLKNHVTDPKLLARVGLRSIDLLANITNQVPMGSWEQKQRVKGKKLKQLVSKNLREKPTRIGYRNRIRFTTNFPIDVSGGTEQPITLGAKGITPLWDEGNASGDFYKFDAYSENDADLTLDLYLHVINPANTSLVLQGETESQKRTIPTKPPSSNLFLNNDGMLTGSHYSDSVGALGSINPETQNAIESSFYTVSVGYDAHALEDILSGWWISTLMADPESNQHKILTLVSGLRKKAFDSTLVDRLSEDISDKNQMAVQSILKEKFAEFGFVLSLNYSLVGPNESLVVINDDLDGTLPTGTFVEGQLYINRVDSAEKYELAVMDSFIKFISKPQIRQRFLKAIEKNQIEPKKPSETEFEFYQRVADTFLKRHLPGEYTRLADFGNANLDWKPADEVGQAIAQVIMDQKPDISVVDNIVNQHGDNPQYIFTLDEQKALRQGKGRRKWYGMPTRDKVHMAQPHAITKEEQAYDGFRLNQRVKFILDKIPALQSNPELYDKIQTWILTPQDQNPDDPISFFVKEQVLSVSPLITVRDPFSAIPPLFGNLASSTGLASRERLTHEFLYQIPRLLMSINHDCFYTGLKARSRFLSSDLPTFFSNEFASAGGPTAAAVIGGAVDQLAWLLNFGQVSPEVLNTVLGTVDRGIDLVAENGLDAFEKSNKSDYKFQGVHNILAMLMCFNRNNFTPFDEMLRALGAVDESGMPGSIHSRKLIVNGKELRDPRIEAFNILFGDGTTKGLLDQIISDPNTMSKTGFTIEENDLIRNVIEKLGKSLSKNDDGSINYGKVKELLKGAITPAMYQAGYPGIYTGLLDKNESGALGPNKLTEQEVEMLARVMSQGQMVAMGRVVDQALGFNPKNLGELKKYIRQNIQNITSLTTSSVLSSRTGTQSAKSRNARLQSMKEWLDVSVRTTTQAMARFEGKNLDPTSQAYKDLEEKLAEDIQTEWGSRLEEAANFWEGKALEDMDADEYNSFIYKMNTILAGSEQAAQHQMMIFALNSRAATPHVMQEDVVDLHRLIFGVHIDKDDFIRYLNKEIYFRYGVETASGRNHMVGWWGVGPEGPKYSQIRTIDPEKGELYSGKEANPYGMWDIQEVPNKDQFKSLFMAQVLLELAKFYKPPEVLGYSVDQESRENYFRAQEERSKDELVAVEVGKYLERAPKNLRKYTAGGKTLTVGEIVERRKNTAGTALQRMYMRTAITDDLDPNIAVLLDGQVDGFAGLRPTLSNIDFTQRGIYALSKAQSRMRISRNRQMKLIEKAREEEAKRGKPVSGKTGLTLKPDDPNNFVDLLYRGYSSIFTKDNMPMIPQSTDDLYGSIILGEEGKVHQNAIQLQNILTNFAKRHGLHDLLEKRDWARLLITKRLMERVYYPTTRSLSEPFENVRLYGDTDDIASKRYTALREAKIRFFDGMLKVLGISSVTLSGNKRYSTIDLMVSMDERQLTSAEITEIKELYGENPGWLQVLSFFANSDKVERLMPLKFGITVDPGTVVRGKAGRLGIPDTAQIPITAFGREIMQVYHVILGTEAAKRIATKLIKGTELEKSAGITYDQAGFVDINSLDPRLDRNLYRQIMKEVIADRVAVTKELMQKFHFVVDRGQLGLIPTEITKNWVREDETDIALSYMGPTDTQARVFTQMDNPSTLHLLTPEAIVQLLNNLENFSFISESELAIQTGKGIYTQQTALDKLMQEEQALLFENLRDNEDKLNEALMFLYTLEPGPERPKILEDFRGTHGTKGPKRIIDTGWYLRNPRSTKLDTNAEINVVNIKYGKIDISVPTADLPFIAKFLELLQIADSLGFTEESKLIQDYIQLVSESVDPNPKGVNASLAKLKVALFVFENYGNPHAEDMAYRFFGYDRKSSQALKMEIDPLLEAMNKIMSVEAHETQQEFYIAQALMERMETVPAEIESTPEFLTLVATTANKPVVDSSTVLSVKAARENMTVFGLEPEIPDVLFKPTASPSVYADDDNFVLSFAADDEERTIAQSFVDYLNNLVNDGVISHRVKEMKLMMVASLCKSQPGFIKNLGFEYNTGRNGESIMNAAKRNGRYVIGMNITAMRVTPENEVIVRFAEELMHIARFKFISQNSKEWNNIIGMYSTARAQPMIREMLIAMNNGKPYAALESEVRYAMDNPDEFFAHMGAFFLLREVFGSKEALAQLSSRFVAVSKGLNVWQRAFYKAKHLVKNVLVTFAKLQNDPEFSDLFAVAEESIMSLIGKGAVERKDVGNPDARANAFRNAATNVNGDQLTAVDIAHLDFLHAESRRVQSAIENERSNTTPDLVAIAGLNSQLNIINQRIKSKNVTTFMGLSLYEVISDMQDLRDFQATAKRRLTERDLIEMGDSGKDVRRAFISYFVKRGMELRGQRSDDAWSLAGFARRLPLAEQTINHVFQGFLLSNFNAARLTYDSPFAPMMVLSNLIDETAVTTQGSFRSDISGIENDKNIIDPYVYNIMIKFSEMSAEYPNDKPLRLNIMLDVVRTLHGHPTTLTDPIQVAHVKSIAESFKIFTTRMRGLMLDSEMIKPTDKLDPFPVRIRNLELLDEDARTMGYEAVRARLEQKQIDLLTSLKEKAPFSAGLMFVSGIFPFHASKAPITTGGIQGELSQADRMFIGIIRDDILNGRPTMVGNGRQAILNHLVRKVGITQARGSATPTTLVDWARRNNSTTIYASVQNETRVILYHARDGSLTFNDVNAFKGMDPAHMSLLLRDYELAVRGDGSMTRTVKELNDSVLSPNNADAKSHFSLPDRPISLKLHDQTGMRGSDLLTLEFLSKCGVAAHLFRTDSVFLNSSEILLSGNPVLLQLFDSAGDSLAKSLGKGTGYDLVERLLVQRISGIPGAYFNITQILNMVESETNENNAKNFYLLDERGHRQTDISANVIMQKALQRLRYAHSETRGILTNNDLSHGRVLQWANSAAKTTVALRYGININTATAIVEGITGFIGSISQADDFISMVINPILYLSDSLGEYTKNKVQQYSNMPVGRKDNRVQVHPIKMRIATKLARNVIPFVEETLSPLLPNNLHHSDATSDMIESLGWWDRFMLKRSRANSTVMRSVMTATAAQANRNILRLLKLPRNGSPPPLMRLREVYRRLPADRKPQSVNDVRRWLETAKVKMDTETAVYLLRSGLMEGKRLETLVKARLMYGTTPTGVLLFQNLFDMEVELVETGRLGGQAIIDGLPANTFLRELTNARSSLAKFQEMYTQKLMVTRKALDAPYIDNVFTNLLTFYKSYPMLFVAQQIMRRSSINPMHKQALFLIVSAVSDFMYNTLLAITRGSMTYDDLFLLEKLTKKKQYGELARVFMRHPVFTNNLLGFITNNAVSSFTGKQNPVLSAVGETAMDQQAKLLFKEFPLALYAAYQNPNNQAIQDLLKAFYNTFGPVITPELMSVPVRLAVNDAHGTARTTHSMTSPDQYLRMYLETMDRNMEEPARATLRGLTPGFPAQLKSRTTYDGIPSDYMREYVKQKARQKPKTLPSIEEVQQQLTPVQPTVEPKPAPTQSLEEQGTTPIPAPM